jgi:hypothetical protein
VSSTITSSYLSPYLSAASSAYTNPTTSTPSALSALNNDPSSGTQDPATNITLSEAAMAYLAGTTTDTSATTSTTPAQSLESIAATLRAWFDDQYKDKTITSPYDEDGKLQIDLSKQDRASLVAAASDTQNLFSDEEQQAAVEELQSRFEDELTPYIAIARKTGNYVQLYQAASDYLDKAGPDERATKSWQDTKKAVVDGLAAAKASPGKAPETGNDNDPVRALLDKREGTGSADAGASAETVAANARSMLDDQANAAKDDGTELVYGASSSGQMVDFSDFDNRTLAVMALNTDGSFSDEEVFAAKSELNVRTRNQMLGILNPSSGSASGSDMNLGLIRTYENMSDEEKQVLGVTDAVTDRLIQNYQSLQSMQNAFMGGISAGGGMMNANMLGLSALLADPDGSSPDISMGLAGLM